MKIQDGESLLDFFLSGRERSGFEKKHHILFLMCYFEFRGTVAGERENWGQAGRRQGAKG